MSTQSNGKSYFQTTCVVIVLATAGWIAYQKYQGPRQMARAAVRDSVREAADEAREVAQVVLASRSPDSTSSDRIDPEPGALIGQMLGLGIDLGHELSKVANDTLDDLAGLTIEEEREIGRQVHELIRTQHKVAASPSEIKRLERLAKPFLENCHRQGIDYHFAIIEDDTVNAFAHLGGYVYVHRGLLDIVRDDDELSFVIGHEIAHGELRHCVKSMTAVVRARHMGGEAVGALTSIACQAVARGYSEDQEFESDAWSYNHMRHLGRSHAQAVAGLRMLERHYGSEEHSDEHATPLAIEYIEDHLRTHPAVADRIARLEGQAKR